MYIADDHYLALDLVLNAAGEGLILAFFHAIVGQSSFRALVSTRLFLARRSLSELTSTFGLYRQG